MYGLQEKAVAGDGNCQVRRSRRCQPARPRRLGVLPSPQVRPARLGVTPRFSPAALPPSPPSPPPQFRALSDQLFRSPQHHAHVRRRVAQQLRAQPARYSPYVPQDYEGYLESMGRDGSWGDHVTLQAAADAFGVRVALLTSFLESCFIEIQPEEQRSERVVWLSFWAEVGGRHSGGSGLGRRCLASAWLEQRAWS
jgi:hypothetical protein